MQASKRDLLHDRSVINKLSYIDDSFSISSTGATPVELSSGARILYVVLRLRVRREGSFSLWKLEDRTRGRALGEGTPKLLPPPHGEANKIMLGVGNPPKLLCSRRETAGGEVWI